MCQVEEEGRWKVEGGALNWDRNKQKENREKKEIKIKKIKNVTYGKGGMWGEVSTTFDAFGG